MHCSTIQLSGQAKAVRAGVTVARGESCQRRFEHGVRRLHAGVERCVLALGNWDVEKLQGLRIDGRVPSSEGLIDTDPNEKAVHAQNIALGFVHVGRMECNADIFSFWPTSRRPGTPRQIAGSQMQLPTCFWPPVKERTSGRVLNLDFRRDSNARLNPPRVWSFPHPDCVIVNRWGPHQVHRQESRRRAVAQAAPTLSR
jgi:hypothetical protein